MIADPGDGQVETLREGDERLPSELAAGEGVIRQKALNFGIDGAQALAILLDFEAAANLLEDDFNQLSDADLLTGAKVKGLTQAACGSEGGMDEAGNGIRDVGEITGAIQVAKAKDRLGEGLGDDGGDDGAGGLARAKCVEGANGDDGQVIGIKEAFGELIGGDFGGGVGRLALERVAFIDGDAAGGAVNFAGGSVDEALDA